ncbi:hypothetical protein FLT15_17000 [Paenibacillus thiaminolyticus]|uniref:hypothetical protein n=1 Tax=Paenibacillus thiaminolyticus TaxID=49283 RepID=UPI0013F68772|nr:hypothetical protein [Paenibacillus thiaminolyticus]NGP59981.1 hypothetical protein [Paenibacillus thiaminolyticus]
MGVVGAFAAWLVITKAQAIAQGISAVATGTSTLAIFAQTWAVQGLRAAWVGLNTAMKANIYILIISIIIGLITWIVQLWKTNDKFAAALMRAWNAILGFSIKYLSSSCVLGME